MRLLFSTLALTLSLSLAATSAFSEELKICAAYQKTDGTYSHNYKLRATITPGAQVAKIIDDGYLAFVEPTKNYLHISWKKGGHTFIDLKGSEIPTTGLLSEDEKGKTWIVKSSWYQCN